MAKLSMSQEYILGFLQRGEGQIEVRRESRTAFLRPNILGPATGAPFNTITLTIPRVDALIKRGLIKRKEFEIEAVRILVGKTEIYIDNPDAQRVKSVKQIPYGGGYYYVKEIPQIANSSK